MKVSLKTLWETGGSLQRFGLIKLQGKALAWKAGRIHRAAMREIEELRRAKQDLDEVNESIIRLYGTEIEIRDEKGISRKVHRVSPGSENWAKYKAEVKKLDTDWKKMLADEVEFWGDPFNINEIIGELRELSIEDIGALCEWLIVGEIEEGESDDAETA